MIQNPAQVIRGRTVTKLTSPNIEVSNFEKVSFAPSFTNVVGNLGFTILERQQNAAEISCKTNLYDINRAQHPKEKHARTPGQQESERERPRRTFSEAETAE